MESAEMQKARYQAKKLNLQIKTVKGGYRFYSENSPVFAVDNFFCNEVMTFEGVKNFLAKILAAHSKVEVNKV